MRPREALSAAAARRVALAAQGFAGGRPVEPASRVALLRQIGRLGLLQIDSVSAVVRSHYLPLFSRLGPYPRDQLDGFAYAGRRRRLFEYWGHEASLLPVEAQPLFRWRMERARAGQGIYGGIARFARERAGYVDAVLAEVRARGPLAAGDLAEGGRGEGGWWGWSDGKLALEFLFWAGLRHHRHAPRLRAGLRPARAGAAARRARRPDARAPQKPSASCCAGRRGRWASRPRATCATISGSTPPMCRLRIAELVEAGELLPVAVEGWPQPAWLDPAARLPRRIDAQALLSPFDSLVWERERTERLFGFRYRLEIYTPAHKRIHGYYVLPFLLGDRLVARVDLRSDRKAGSLRVVATHLEQGVDERVVVGPLANELRLLADWLGLDRVD